MALVYVGSVRAFAGKNMVCLGLARRLLDDGFNLAFTKPYGGKPLQVEGQITDADAWNLNQQLELKQDPVQCCPVVRTQDLLAQALRGETGDLMAKIKAHCQEMENGRDLLFMAGEGTLRSGAMMGIGGYQMVLETGAKAVLVDRYQNEFFLDDVLSARYRLGDNLAGVIINDVDQEMNEALAEQVIPFLERSGVPTLGVLPRDELLASVSVGELGQSLGAKILTGHGYLGRLVKRIFIGAMQVAHAQSIFGGAHDFACIVGGDRPDMQLAAIEGGAACLVLSGDLYPGEIILSRAEEHQVPVLVARGDTYSVAHAVEQVRMRSSLGEPEKVARAQELVAGGVDFSALYRRLGLRAP